MFYQVKDGATNPNTGGYYGDLAMMQGAPVSSDTNICESRSTGGGGSHSHGATTTTADTGSKGSNTAFSTLNPNMATYIWKRTA